MLLKDTGLISTPENVSIFENVGNAIALLKKQGFKIIMVSNQTVVSRGILSYAEMIKLNDYILNQIKNQNNTAIFDELYFSPFHSKAVIETYRKDSECRKPRPGMLLEAQKKYDIDFNQSIIIGDRLSDIYAGKSVGCIGIQLLTGNENEPLIETTLPLNPLWLKPDYTFKSLYEAALFIKELQ